MQLLKERYLPLTLTELVDALESDAVPPGAVAITLDDGCLDNLTVASPILEALALPATFFITTDRLDARHEFWWDELERILIASSGLPSRLDLSTYGDLVYPTGTPDERLDTCDRLAVSLRNRLPNMRDHIMRGVARWAGIPCPPRDSHRPMLAAEVARLSRRPGHAIGAHSIHHVGLPLLPVDMRREELRGSRDALEQLLQVEVAAFAYPYGHFDTASLEMAREVFRTAVTTVPRPVCAGDDTIALARFDAGAMSAPDLRTALDSIHR